MTWLSCYSSWWGNEPIHFNVIKLEIVLSIPMIVNIDLQRLSHHSHQNNQFQSIKYSILRNERIFSLKNVENWKWRIWLAHANLEPINSMKQKIMFILCDLEEFTNNLIPTFLEKYLYFLNQINFCTSYFHLT